MLRNLKDNNHGIVFVTVLIIIIIAMVLTVSILGFNISQVKSSENELKFIQAGLLSEGGLARMLVSQSSLSPSNLITYSETVGSTTFTVVANIDSPGSGPAGSETDPLKIDVTF